MTSRFGTALSLGLFASIAMAHASGRAHAAEESAAPPPSADDRQYRACLASAGAVHDAGRTAECKRLAEQTDSDRANCLNKLNLPKIYCDTSYAPRDPTANCKLPDEVATVLDAALARARFRCARALRGEEGNL